MFSYFIAFLLFFVLSVGLYMCVCFLYVLIAALVCEIKISINSTHEASLVECAQKLNCFCPSSVAES